MLVSIVMPAYNATRWLEEAIRSVTSQFAGDGLEVVLVDDASTDGTADLARAIDPRVRVIRQDRGGRSAARNRGLLEARGRFVGFLDADDAWHPDKLAAQLEYLERHPGAVAVLTSLERFGADTSPVHDPWSDRAVRGFGAVDFLVRDVGHPASLLVRREATAGLAFPHGVHAVEDRIFLALLREHGEIGFIPRPLYRYRTHPRPHFSSEKLRWHRYESLRRWAGADGARCGLPVTEADRVARHMLADELDADYYARRFETFETERARLRDLWGDDPPHPVFSRRLWPGWVFRLKDAVDAWRQPAPSPART